MTPLCSKEGCTNDGDYNSIYYGGAKLCRHHAEIEAEEAEQQ